LGRERNAALIVMNDPILYTERRTIAEQAARLRMPAVYPLRGFVEAGGLISYGPNPEANFVRAASYVDRILKGAKPSELAVEPPARFELAINREAARALGLTLRPQLLRQATAIID
jgi:putative ABC transport system substrate-binding protein